MSVARNKVHIPIALRLVLALAALIAVGTLALLLPGMTTRPITPVEALFTATSAAAVTGLTLVPTSTTFTLLGQITLLALVQIGGVGLLFAMALLFRLLGRPLALGDRLTVVHSMGLESTRGLQSLLARSTLLMLAIEGAGAVLLYLHWRLNAITPPGDAAFYALFHAITAFCNAGFDLFTGLPAYPDGLPSDTISLLILGALVIIGGFGYPLYIDILHWHGSRRLSLNTQLTLYAAALLILAGMAGLLISEYRFGGVLSGQPWTIRVVHAWFQSVAARTAGFQGLADFAAISEESRLLLTSLMFIGTAPASMGGGITTGTFIVLALAAISFGRGFRQIQVRHYTISLDVLMRAIAVLAISIFSVLLATWLLLLTHDFAMDAALFEVVSAYSTTGLSLGITGELNVFGRLVIIAMMFWGRLGAITIVIALLQRQPRVERIRYPEAKVFVG